MPTYTAYSYPDGRIDSVYTCEPASEILIQPAVLERGCHYALGDFDPEVYYLPAGDLTIRPVLTTDRSVTIAADDVEEYVLPLPPGTEIIFERQTVVCGLDDPLVFKSPVPGDHEIQLSPPFPWRPTKVVVTCL